MNGPALGWGRLDVKILGVSKFVNNFFLLTLLDKILTPFHYHRLGSLDFLSEYLFPSAKAQFEILKLNLKMA